jgi:hypothetical protein
LEATLDKNDTFHLFPKFAKNKTFQQLFPWEDAYFGKKNSEQRLN